MIIYISQKEAKPVTEVYKQTGSTEIEEWTKPESIKDVVDFLNAAEDPSALAALRELIPADILKIAARSLLPQKREQIKQWVVAAN